MELAARMLILVVLLVNKLSVLGGPTLKDINSTAENATRSNDSVNAGKEAFSEFKFGNGENIFLKHLHLTYNQAEAKDVKDIGGRLAIGKNDTANSLASSEVFSDSPRAGEEEGITISDTAQNKDRIVIQKLPTESEDTFLISQSHNLASTNIPDLSKKQEKSEDFGDFALKSTELLSEENKMVPKQKDKQDKLNNFNLSWPENSAKTINEYRIATKPLTSNVLTQSPNLGESELIEIVLKEATNLNKRPDESNLSPELTLFTTNSVEVSPLYKAESVLTTDGLKEEVNLATERKANVSTLLENSAPINNTELISIVLKYFERSQNYSGGDSELVTKDLKDVTKEAVVDTTTAPSDNTDETLKPSKVFKTPQFFNVTKNKLETSDLYANKIQEENNAFKLRTNLADAGVLSPGSSNNSRRSQAFDEQGRTALKEVPNLDRTPNHFSNSLGSSAVAAHELNPKLSYSSKKPLNYSDTENKLLEEVAFLNKTRNENSFKSVKASPPLETTVLTPQPLKSVKGPHDCTMKDNELQKEDLQLVSTLASKELNPKPLIGNEEPEKSNNSEEGITETASLSVKVTDLSSVEPLAELATSSSSNFDPITDPWNKFKEPQNSISLEEGEELTSKPVVSLEEYAVKQMNFIVDHLLLETQKFVAKVLQATINSVFPRDRLKLYAEGVNRVLNPITESEYSDEPLENIKTASQGAIYEEIVEKLEFLKNKPSKYLEKQMPAEWLADFLDKRAELALWLDKAADQMHKQFTDYISEGEDPIKYQYFNETFDDISRATEIHHKLALLADLVKIIKNKKQITFMDLYMQT